MSSSEYYGWLAVGVKGKSHYFNEIDEFNPMKRISLCGKKLHVFNLIEPTEQSQCVLCLKFMEPNGLSIQA